MVLPKTVIITTVVTQINIALPAVPHCLVSHFLVVVAVVTSSTVPFPSDRKVCLTKAA